MKRSKRFIPFIIWKIQFRQRTYSILSI
jgi:hypothetical protein